MAAAPAVQAVIPPALRRWEPKVANPSPDRVGRWIVDSATYIPALQALKGSDQGAYEDGLGAIGLAMIYQSSRIFALQGGIIEDMGGGYVNYQFEDGVSQPCSSGSTRSGKGNSASGVPENAPTRGVFLRCILGMR
jgi:hypothetical protein